MSWLLKAPQMSLPGLILGSWPEDRLRQSIGVGVSVLPWTLGSSLRVTVKKRIRLATRENTRTLSYLER